MGGVKRTNLQGKKTGCSSRKLWTQSEAGGWRRVDEGTT